MEKIIFSDATQTAAAKVTIAGVDHEVTEATYSGGTNLNASTFNTMQTNMENASIVESGSNANGSYVKFGDGTMICTGKLIKDSAINNAIGNMFRTATIPFNNFPVSFTRLDDISFDVSNGVDGSFVWIGYYGGFAPSNTNPGRVALFSPTSVATTSVTISYTAIGKWK